MNDASFTNPNRTEGIVEKLESLRRAVQYGLDNGKKSMIVDLDVLAFAFQLTVMAYCEHGVEDGDWCEPCSKAMKTAAAENYPPDEAFRSPEDRRWER